MISIAQVSSSEIRLELLLKQQIANDLACDQLEQISDLSMRLDRMPQRFLGQDFIVILAANLFAANEPFGFKFLNNPLDGSLRDTDLIGDLS